MIQKDEVLDTKKLFHLEVRNILLKVNQTGQSYDDFIEQAIVVTKEWIRKEKPAFWWLEGPWKLYAQGLNYPER